MGVYDSGVGGLSVLRALLAELPYEQFVFVADEAYLPYGDKPQHVIVERVLHIANWIRQQESKAIVIACNTATAAGAAQARLVHATWPIVGIEPAVKPATMMTQSGVVGILATSNTLASDRFRALVARCNPLAHVIAQPCPGLVELIEQVPLNPVEIRAHLQPVVDGFLRARVDVIVLGCTHYPFVANVISSLTGPSVRIIETGVPVARQLHKLLSEEDIACAERGLAVPDIERVRFFTTGNPALFSRKLGNLLGAKWAGVSVSGVPQ